jgi:DNA/RNA-binding domain of Phe-tRNA-synthetase-like protein
MPSKLFLLSFHMQSVVHIITTTTTNIIIIITAAPVVLSLYSI